MLYTCVSTGAMQQHSSCKAICRMQSELPHSHTQYEIVVKHFPTCYASSSVMPDQLQNKQRNSRGSHKKKDIPPAVPKKEMHHIPHSDVTRRDASHSTPRRYSKRCITSHTQALLQVNRRRRQCASDADQKSDHSTSRKAFCQAEKSDSSIVQDCSANPLRL